MSTYLEMHVNHSSVHPNDLRGLQGPLALSGTVGRSEKLTQARMGHMPLAERTGNHGWFPSNPSLPGRPFLAGPLSAAANSQTAAPLVATTGTAFPAGPPAAQPLVHTRGPQLGPPPPSLQPIP